jgi:hypothetical protein
VLVNPPLSVTRRSHTMEIMYAVEAPAFGMRVVFDVKVSDKFPMGSWRPWRL